MANKHSLEIKVCGIASSFQEILELEPDYLGFIMFEKSPRHVGMDFLLGSLPIVNGKTRSVLVVVNAEIHDLQSLYKKSRFDVVQLHGDEDILYAQELRASLPEVEIWKAVSIHSAGDLLGLTEWEGLINRFVFDAAGAERGGNGIKFSWEILDKYNISIPFMLAGGISLEDLDEIISLSKNLPSMVGIDINSKFEISPGLKNPSLVSDCINYLRSN